MEARHVQGLAIARSPAHALTWGLRLAGHEAQLTQVIAAVGSSDPRFACAFVELVLAAASKYAGHPASVRELGAVPQELDCAAEHSVYDHKDRRLGRVDLRFDGEDFTLLIENKLHSRFGERQLARYQQALELLPAGRAGLVAITRDVPSHAELSVRGRGWLGAVRWAHLAEGLRKLPIADPFVADQWPLLIDVLDSQGDLGVTSVDHSLPRAWARYLEGRAVLIDLLDSIRERALDVLRSELSKRYPDHGPGERLCAPFTHGKRGMVAVKSDQQTVWTGFNVPAREKSAPAVGLSFWMEDGDVMFGVAADPYNGPERVRRKERQLAEASRRLLKAGFQSDDSSWWRQYPSSAFLDDEDVPARLLALVKKDVRALVTSDILLADVQRLRRRTGPRLTDGAQ
jgi:hypothetical protein